jgi:hypothetical protein
MFKYKYKMYKDLKGRWRFMYWNTGVAYKRVPKDAEAIYAQLNYVFRKQHGLK